MSSNTQYDVTYPEGYSVKYPIMWKDCGKYDPTVSYSYKNVVKWLGSVFESRIDDNTHIPATYNRETQVVYFNTDYWKILVNSTADYILHLENVKNSNDISELYSRQNVIEQQVSGIETNIGKIKSDIIELKEKDIDLQEQIDQIISSDTDISLTISPNVIFRNIQYNVSLKSVINTSGQVISHSINRGQDVIISGTSTTLNANVTVSSGSNIIYTSTANINGSMMQKSSTLTIVDKIYYGSGVNPSDANISFETPKTTPAGTYNVTIRRNMDYVFFDVPESMTIHTAKVNGFDMPFVIVDSSRTGYKCYKSTNTYDAGNMTIVLT